MRGIFVIVDGLGDLPNSQLNGQTPLEAANTPNLDFLNARGEMGYMYSVRPTFIPGTDEAIVSIFENDLISSSRGQLEAAGAGIKITRGDLALRVNFATIDSLKSGNILDRRAGRTLTTKEAEILAKELNNKIKLPFKFIFKSTVQHRGVLVFKGGFSDNLSGNDIPGQTKISLCKSLDEYENTQYTVNIVNEFLNQAYEILDKHPINEERRKKGLLPANYILIRGAGIEIPKLKIYKNWLSCVYMPLMIGFSKLSGMKTYSFEYPKFKEMDFYNYLYNGLEKACKFSIETLKNNYKKADFAFIYIKETDVPGHDNKPLEKKAMIEFIDANLFKFLKDFATQNNVNIIVTGDHSTPCKLKTHSSDPVPVLFYNHSLPKENRKFCEKNARLGSLGRIEGKNLLKKLRFSK